MARFEYKYLVRVGDLDALREALAPFLERDPYVSGEVGEYTVHSVYYDSCSLDYYYEKEAGIQHRKKIRVRGYNWQPQDASVFLEIKRKNNMAVSKHRAPVRYQDTRALFANGEVEHYVLKDHGFQDAEEDARRFFYHIYRYSLHPVVLVRYEREAFFRKFNGSVRITFDKNLRSMAYPSLEDLFRDGETVSALSGYFVLEVKFHDGVPSWLRAILEGFGLERQSISKYTICLDTLGIPEHGSKQSVLAFSKDVPPNSFRPSHSISVSALA